MKEEEFGRLFVNLIKKMSGEDGWEDKVRALILDFLHKWGLKAVLPVCAVLIVFLLLRFRPRQRPVTSCASKPKNVRTSLLELNLGEIVEINTVDGYRKGKLIAVGEREVLLDVKGGLGVSRDAIVTWVREETDETVHAEGR